MADVVDSKTRSRMMAGIRGKNTKPEIAVRKFLFANGLRFRLHKKGLPGKPDIVLAKHSCVVLVHGCFWHQHRGCIYATTPKTNSPFWQQKFEQTALRDIRTAKELRRLGWRVLRIWECDIDAQGLQRLLKKIKKK